ncbi:carbohydrate ABC transporter permease [Psychromicrobium xiongbiense]|uniref:carbohydrate ABC transporter permease n=1 Tax=Psychromicrobium xiongbiense TaxID=3051184 RepID=UPI0025521908|nr:carbohydrate ABC transporter permease [Psychromicrobium sp. YIM S02556]
MAKKSSLTKRASLNILGVIFALLWIFPIYWLLNSSFSTEDALNSRTPSFFPAPFTAQHFQSILADPAFFSALKMSFFTAILVVVVAIVFAFFAALALSRFRFIGRRGLILSVLVIQMVPAEALFISQYKMIDGWHLLNSILGLSILYIGASLPFTIWMLKGFVDGVPVELEESAQIDGCSRMGAFFRVTFPLLGSGIVASSIFSFLAAWNEYTLALVLLSSNDTKTLPLWLQGFSTQMAGTDWGGVMAGSTLMAIPVIILFVIVQKRMATGMVAGAVKG